MKTNLDPITALFEASRSMTSAIRILRGTELHQEKGETIFDRVNEAIAYLANRRDVTDATARSIAPRKSDAALIVELRARVIELAELVTSPPPAGLDPENLTPSDDNSKTKI